MLFGTSRLRNVGSDLGSAIRGFRDSMNKDKSDSDTTAPGGPQDDGDREKPSS